MANYLALLSKVDPDLFDQWAIRFLKLEGSLKRADTSGLFCTNRFSSKRYTTKSFREPELERFVEKTFRLDEVFWDADLVVKFSCVHSTLRKISEKIVESGTNQVRKVRAQKLLTLLDAYKKKKAPFTDLTLFLR